MARKLKPQTPVAERLVALREEFGLTREELAQRLDWNASTMAKYEQGRNFPDPEFLKRVQDLGISLDWIITGRGEMYLIEAKHTEPEGAHEGTSMTAPALALDEDLMARLVDGITAAYKEAGQGLAPIHLGRMAARLVNEIVAASDGPEDYPGALKMRLAQLRKELQSAASDPASSKRSA